MIGEDCWNMIIEMKNSLEHREKYSMVMSELLEKYDDIVDCFYIQQGNRLEAFINRILNIILFNHTIEYPIIDIDNFIKVMYDEHKDKNNGWNVKSGDYEYLLDEIKDLLCEW